MLKMHILLLFGNVDFCFCPRKSRPFSLLHTITISPLNLIQIIKYNSSRGSIDDIAIMEAVLDLITVNYTQQQTLKTIF